MSQSFFKVTLVIVILNSLGYMASEIYLPSFPSIEHYFKTTESSVQFTLFVYMVSFTVSPLFFGPWSDKLGRGYVIRIGLIIALFATLGCTFAPTIKMLMVSRFIQGIGFGAVTVATRSLLADFYEGTELNRQISYLSIAMPLFVAVAPIVGGMIEHFASWREVFAFLIVYLVASYLLSLRFKSYNKAEVHPEQPSLRVRYAALLQNKSFVYATLFMPIPLVGFFAYLTAGPFIYQTELGLSPAEYGSLSLWNAMAIIVMGFVNSKLIDYWSTEKMLLLGGLMMFTAASVLALGVWLHWNAFWILLTTSLLFIGSAPVIGANSSQRAFSSIKSHFGLAAALMMTIQFLGAVAGTFIFSMIPDGITPLIICYAGCAAVLFILLILER